MDVETPIARAVRILGGQTAASRALNVSQPTVWNWIRRGKITAENVLAMEAKTEEAGERVGRHELRPDLYSAPEAAA